MENIVYNSKNNYNNGDMIVKAHYFAADCYEWIESG